jgi:hypothetical protein
MKPIKLYTDLSVHLYEGEAAKKRGTPTPIIFLTQWQMMGNSTVHTDEYLTQWKVSGNSVVDNNAILSCGDYSDVDGKYHVKISNGVTIYDIPLTEPLRKVNDVADNITFVNGVATVTRNNAFIRQSFNSGYNGYFDSSGTIFYTTAIPDIVNMTSNERFAVIICNKLQTSFFARMQRADTVAIGTYLHTVVFRNYEIEQTEASYKAWLATLGELDIIYQLETPTTEIIQVSPFPVSPTDTYTSANDTAYSAFEYKKNVEIWSCGEYSAVDGKYHIVVLPEGKSPVDIALDEPIRKVGDVADSIEFANGVGTLTRKIVSVPMSSLNWTTAKYSDTGKYRYNVYSLRGIIKQSINNNTPGDILCTIYNTTAANGAYATAKEGIAVDSTYGSIYLYDANYDQEDDLNAFLEHIQGVEMLYALATPTTEVIQVPQIQEAESYSCVISQGGKAVSWSSFETE